MDRASAVSVLSRTTFSNPTFTPLQAEVDSLASSFVHQATDWRNLAAFTVGGAAYRLGRLGAFGSAGGISRLGSVALGLGAEVSAYEITHRSLLNGSENPNLWRWSGRGGLAQGFLQSTVTFGTLRGAGAVVAGQNPVLQHLVQDAAMVSGHHLSAFLGATPRPTGSLAEQFLHSEATLWQIQAGMSLFHGASPRITALERSLDLSLAGRGGNADSQGVTERALASAGAPSGGRQRGFHLEHVMWMSGNGGKNGSPGRDSSDITLTRIPVEPRVPEIPEGLRYAETSPDPLVAVSERGIILYTNPALNELLGYEVHELVGQALTVLIPPSYRKAHLAGFQRFLTSNQRNVDWGGLDVPALNKSGDWVQVKLSLGIHHGNTRMLVGTLRPHSAERADGTPRIETPKPAAGTSRDAGLGGSSLSPLEFTGSYDLGKALAEDNSSALRRLTEGDLYLRVQVTSFPRGEVFLKAYRTALRTKMKSRDDWTSRIVSLELRTAEGAYQRYELAPDSEDFVLVRSKISSSERSYPGLPLSPDASQGARAVRSEPVAAGSQLKRLREELSVAARTFREAMAREGEIEIPIPSQLGREFLEANAEQVVQQFHNLVWGHLVTPGRRVKLNFKLEGGTFLIEMEKAEGAGYRLRRQQQP